MDQDEAVSQFCAVVNCDPERAKFFLSAANWEVESALNAYFLDGTGDDTDEVRVVDPPANESQPPTLKDIATQGQPKAPREQSRFGTISAFRSDDESSEDEDNQHYAGGSKNSGQLIKGPPKDKVKVQDVFNSAKEHGAEVVDDHGSEKKRPTAAFAGSGFKLGDQAGSSASVPVASSVPRPPQEQRSTITFWKGGFSVDDGPLRKMEDPANKEFLSSVMRGEIPQELVKQARGAEVHVNMVDKRTEEFQPPKKVLRPFSGSGFKLGSPVPDVVTNSTAVRTPTNPPLAPSVSINESAPTTSIQIRLADGTRLVSKFNHTHTISDIRGFIDLSRPGTGSSYSLMTTFPNKVLSTETQTIAEAGLLNAVIVQRKV